MKFSTLNFFLNFVKWLSVLITDEIVECRLCMVTTQLQKEAGALKERLSSLEAEFAQLSANQQAATDNLEQMAKSADVCDRYKNHLRSFC